MTAVKNSRQYTITTQFLAGFLGEEGPPVHRVGRSKVPEAQDLPLRVAAHRQ
jgi:hypothetical protein